MKNKEFAIALLSVVCCLLSITSCTDDEGPAKLVTWDIGDPTAAEYNEDYYAGGQLGTTTDNTATAYQQPTKSVESAGMMTTFNEGEYLFEKDYNTNTEGRVLRRMP